MVETTKVLGMNRAVKYIILILAQALIIYISYINIFPDGYFFSAHDVSYPFNPLKDFLGKIYIWNPESIGRFYITYSSGPYYFLIHLLNRILNLNLSSQSFLYYAIFLSSAFWGMYFTTRLLSNDKKISLLNFFMPLIYTFNSYTSYVFYFQYGFSHFLLLYAIFPIIIGLLYRYLGAIAKKERKLYLAILCLVLSLTNIINANIPFFFSLNVILLGFFIFYYIFLVEKNPTDTRFFLNNVLILYFVYGLTVFWSVFPQINQQVSAYEQGMSGGTIYNLKDWMFSHALSFRDILTMSPPYRYYYNYDSRPLMQMSYYSWIFVFVLVYLSIKRCEKKNRRFLKVLLGTLVVALFLANKGKGLIPEDLMWYIFKNPFLASIRSFDKTLIFIPSLFIIPIFFFLKNCYLKKILKVALCLILSMQVILSYPLLIGKMQKYYSFLHDSGKNYQSSKYTSLLKVPVDYTHISEYINNQDGDFRLLGIPYHAVVPGFANYPKWGVWGVDPTYMLFNSPVVNMNESVSDFPLWNYGKIWNENLPDESTWLLSFSSTLNVRYLIYHKDIDPTIYEENLDKIKYYLEQGFIRQLYNGDHLDLYEIDSKYYTDKIYIAKDVVITGDGLEKYPNIIRDSNLKNKFAVIFNQEEGGLDYNLSTKSSCSSLEFKKTSPVKYTVSVNGFSGRVLLVFSEKYHRFWKLKFLSSSTLKEFEHIEVNGYANAWLLDSSILCENANTCNLELELFFTHQIIYLASLIVTLVTIITSLIYLIYYYIFLNKTPNE